MRPLIDQETVVNWMLKDAPYAHSHQVAGMTEHLGSGMIYYALAYSIPAKLCVCLGSGNGYVPRLMRQAQIDARLTKSETVLVDADMPSAGYGWPDYFNKPDCFFRKEWDVTLVHKTTEDAASDFQGRKIDYLHIDADHSASGVLADFYDWSPLISNIGAITLHDTTLPGVALLVERITNSREWNVLDFRGIGNGVAIVRKNLLYEDYLMEQSGDKMKLSRREKYGVMLNKLGLVGSAAEIGVHRGEFSRALLNCWHGKMLYLVDPWKSFTGDEYTEPRDSDFDACMKNLEPHIGRFEVLRDFSLDAAKKIPDASLDFCYIDANHRSKYIRQDLYAWWPKVKPGGILAGHDYVNATWPDVRAEVDAFVGRLGLTLHTNMQPWGEWWIVK